METKHEKPINGLQPEENKAKPELPEDVMQLLANPMFIAAIKCARNYVYFWMTDKTKVKLRITFCNLLPWLNPTIFLQVHRCWVINLHFMEDECHKENASWVKLITDKLITVSDNYYDIFVDNLFYMNNYKRIRLSKH